MALANTLNTNEVKNSSGVEVEFERMETVGRKTTFKQIAETPSLPHRLSVAHQEVGTGLKLRRRSVVRVDKTIMSTVDATVPVTVSAYLVLDTPVGAITTNAEPANVIAEVLSFCASLGATTTILFDGTGNGARELIQGGL